MDREMYLQVIKTVGFVGIEVKKTVVYDSLRGKDYGVASITVGGAQGINRTTAEVWEDFSPQLRQFISKRVANVNDVDDILQDVFIEIHTNLDMLQEEDRLVPWLYQITRNTIIDHYRMSRPTEELPETLAVNSEAH